MSKNTGKDFELLTFELYSGFTAKDPSISVEHDVQLAGPDGPRQIDILIRSNIAGHELLTIIECRDYKRALNVTAVGRTRVGRADPQTRRRSPDGGNRTGA